MNVHVEIEKHHSKKSWDKNKRTSLKRMIKCKKLFNFVLFEGHQKFSTQPYQTIFSILHEEM